MLYFEFYNLEAAEELLPVEHSDALGHKAISKNNTFLKYKTVTYYGLMNLNFISMNFDE